MLMFLYKPDTLFHAAKMAVSMKASLAVIYLSVINITTTLSSVLAVLVLDVLDDGGGGS
jgi:hypothetical protein